MRKIVYNFLPTLCPLVYLHFMKVLEEQYFGMLNLNILIEVISMLMITFLGLVNSILFMFFLSLTQPSLQQGLLHVFAHHVLKGTNNIV
jgi:hypothetical protein